MCTMKYKNEDSTSENTLKGVLQVSIVIVKAFLTQNCPVENLRKICVFSGKWCLNVKFCFQDPQKAHPCTKPRHLTYRY